MPAQYRCTRCDSKWNVEAGEDVSHEDEVCAHCPICTVKDLRGKEREVKELKKILKSYRDVFQDIGVKNIEVQEGE